MPTDKRSPGIPAVLATAILAAAMSSSCVEPGPAGPVATLIPAEAIAAVVIESPYKLHAVAEEFWKAAGLDRTLGSDLQGLLSKSVPNASQALQVFDFARPWALALLPSPGPKKTRQLLYVPYRSKPDELAASLFDSLSMTIVANAKGYLVLSDAEGYLAFPPAKGADLSRLARYPASSIKIWGDPQAIKSALSDGYKPIQEAIRSFVTPPPASEDALASGDPMATRGPQAAKALGEFGLSLLAQLGLADAAIEPGASGLVLRGGAATRGGSDLRKAIAAASFAPSALDWAAQVGSSALYGYAWSMDPAIAAGLYGQMMESLLPSLGLPADLAAKATALQSRWAKAAGPRGALSLDMDIDASAFAGVKDMTVDDPAAVAELMKKLLRMKFAIFQEVKNETVWRALLKGMATDPDYLAFAQAYAEAFGISFAIRSQDRKVGGFAYGELGIDLTIIDAAKLGALSGEAGSASAQAATQAALTAMVSMLSARWTVANGRFVATGGDPGELETLARRKAVDKALSADPAFAAFAKTMPPRTVMVGTLSMRKFMALVSSLAAAGAASGDGMPDPELFGSWYSYFALDARGLAPGFEAGLFMPASDIGALFQSAGALFRKPAAPAGGI